MNLSSLEFAVFVLVVLLLQWATRTTTRERWLLLIASYLFYLSWSVYGVLVIAATSASDYYIGRRIGSTADGTRRRRWLLLSLALNVGLLMCVKYVGLLGAAFGPAGMQVPGEAFLLPGVSYFTFAGISYVVDVYYERGEPARGLREYVLYIAYFPKLLAGPIVRACEFLPQLRHAARANAEDLEIGLAYFMSGVVKKVVIADQIAGNVDLIFAAPGQFDGLTLLQGAVGYAVQIYCDFSGYSDMAIGCARVMGFRFPENFQMPYSAVTITEFWRRWHMTLSSWLRDYVFMPLELATRHRRRSVVRSSVNLLITMLVCGLWHGASWNFVVWGAMHGVALAVHRIWQTWRPLRSARQGSTFRGLSALASRGTTLAFVLVAWIVFRAATLADANEYLWRLMTWTSDGTRLMSPYILAATAAVFVFHFFIDKDRTLLQDLPHRSPQIRIGAYAVLTVLISLFAAGNAAPFLYFRF